MQALALHFLMDSEADRTIPYATGPLEAQYSGVIFKISETEKK
jgi:hypothetical protein